MKYMRELNILLLIQHLLQTRFQFQKPHNLHKEVCKAYIYNSEKKSTLGLYDPLYDLIVAMIATDIGKLSIADDIGVQSVVDDIIKKVFAEINL